ncbi:Zinc finger CCCH domain-containing protein 7 [Hordeum vulgare]|nr:Zinc finger CCCH domain-containing protein 7 [Hordeum vulgare]
MAKDDHGEFIAVAGCFIPHVVSTDVAETIDIRNGLYLAAKIGCNSLQIESDSSNAVEAFITANFLEQEAAILLESKDLNLDYANYEVHKCPREANCVADCVAKPSLSNLEMKRKTVNMHDFYASSSVIPPHAGVEPGIIPANVTANPLPLIAVSTIPPPEAEPPNEESNEMQCLPDEMIKIFSSTKRSLLDTLEQTESEKKGKFQEESSKWGPVLSIRPTTRGHGDIGIMDKAKEYQKKKNLEIPKTFKGNSFSCLDKNVLAVYAKKVDVCLDGLWLVTWAYIFIFWFGGVLP